MSICPKEARRAYRSMPFQEFARIYETHRDDPEAMLGELERAESAALRVEAALQETLREVRERLSASEQHRLLAIAVPAGVDLEHVQAIIMYGFIMPSQEHCYMGSNVLPEHHVRKNVRNKLGRDFDDEKYNDALKFLRSGGAINWERKHGDQDTAVSLKSSAAETTNDFCENIVRRALEFAQRKRRRES